VLHGRRDPISRRLLTEIVQLCLASDEEYPWCILRRRGSSAASTSGDGPSRA
jgi:hypothetical protein